MSTIYLSDALLADTLLADDLAQIAAKSSPKIVSIGEPTTSSSNPKRVLLTAHAPKLNSVNPPTSGTLKNSSADTFLGILAAFMSAMILFQILESKNESSLNAAQNNTSNSFVTLAQDQAKTAEDQFLTYQKEYEASQKNSLLGRIFGGIAAGLCCLLSGLTGGLTAFIATGLITGFMMSPAIQKLSDAMTQAGLPLWAQGLIKLGIVIVATVVICGISGLIEDATEDAAAQAAKQAAGNSSGIFTKAQLLASGGQLLIALNPLGDLITAAAQTHQSDAAAQLIGELTGLLLSIVSVGLLGLAAYYNSAGGELAKTVGDALGRAQFSKLSNIFYFFRATTNLTSASFNVATGTIMLKQSTLLGEMGDTKKNQIIYQALLTMMNQSTQSELKQFNNQMDVLTQLSAQFNAFVEPGAQAAEILG